MAIALSIAAEMSGNAMTAGALESAVLTGESFTADFIRSVGTVAVVVAPVSTGDAFAIGNAAEFRSRAFAVLMAAEFVIFIVAVSAIVLEIASPPARNAALVLALEFGRFVAFRALFRQFIRA